MDLQHRKPTVELLATVDLFAACNPNELNVIARHTDEVEILTGRVVCEQGEPGQQFCIIMDGSASVSIDGDVIATLGRGDFFGEISLLDGGPDSATITADAGTRLLILTRHDLEVVIEAAPTLKWKLLAGMSRRLRAADQALAQTLDEHTSLDLLMW